MKRDAILRRIVEPLLDLEGILAVVRAIGVLCHPMPKGDKLVKNVLEFFPIRQSALGLDLPRPLPRAAVGLFRIHRQLRERLLFAVELDRLSPANLLIGLLQLGLLDLKRDVFLAKDIDLGANAAIEHGKALARQIAGRRAFSILDVQLVHAWFALRLDVLDEIQIRRLSGLVVRLTRHLDVAIGADFVDGGRHLAERDEPFIEGAGRLDRHVAELVDIRLDYGPVIEYVAVPQERSWKLIPGQFSVFSDLCRFPDDPGGTSRARVIGAYGAGQARNRAG